MPLSDSRLKPRNTRKLLAIAALLMMALIYVTFIFVPRGMSVGGITVASSKMIFNNTSRQYELRLAANVPVYNPNHFAATFSGRVNVSFYDQLAGSGHLEAQKVPKLSRPQNITLTFDASNLPSHYLPSVIEQCYTYPRKLIFFLTADFTAQYLGYAEQLPFVDTYFLLDCVDADNFGSPTRAEPVAAAH